MRTLGLSFAVVVLLAFTTIAQAQGFTEPYWIGKTIWFKPASASYRQIEFYLKPTLNSTAIVVSKKTAFVIDEVEKGWLTCRSAGGFAGRAEMYLPLSMMRTFLYRSNRPNRLEFERSSFFLEDPDVVWAAIVADLDAGKKPVKKSGIDSAMEPYQSWKHPAWKKNPQ